MVYQYKNAQVCKNGHIITGNIENGDTAKFCSLCGAETITACGECGASIRGDVYEIGWSGVAPMDAKPAFCPNCGTPYDWTQRQIQAAKDLADEIDDIDDAERERAKGSFVDLVSDNPQTTVAAARVSKLISNAGPVVGSAIKEIAISIATDAAKKLMGL